MAYPASRRPAPDRRAKPALAQVPDVHSPRGIEEQDRFPFRIKVGVERSTAVAVRRLDLPSRGDVPATDHPVRGCGHESRITMGQMQRSDGIAVTTQWVEAPGRSDVPAANRSRGCAREELPGVLCEHEIAAVVLLGPSLLRPDRNDCTTFPVAMSQIPIDPSASGTARRRPSAAKPARTMGKLSVPGQGPPGRRSGGFLPQTLCVVMQDFARGSVGRRCGKPLAVGGVSWLAKRRCLANDPRAHSRRDFDSRSASLER